LTNGPGRKPVGNSSSPSYSFVTWVSRGQAAKSSHAGAGTGSDVLAGKAKAKRGFALADLLSGRGLERPCEVLVAWAREA
jgi:hypothetical protein